MSLYVSQQKCELLDSLETQVRFSQLVAVVVGARGLGKSFLLEQLHSRLKDEVAIANVDASMAMSEDQLDKTISLQLGLSWQESNTDIATRITNTHSEKVLITIDNAHLLSASCLEFILRLNQSQLADKESLLFILLAGENSLPAMINRTSTFSNHPEMCVVFEIEPIKQSETRSLIETFSHPNSEVLKELKNGSKLDYFWQLANGNPAELNYHMSRWLDEHSPTQVVEVDSVAQPKVAVVIKAIIYSILAIVLSTMLVYQDEINQWISPQSKERNIPSEPALATDSTTIPKSVESNSEANTNKGQTETDNEITQQFEQELATAETGIGDQAQAENNQDQLSNEKQARQAGQIPVGQTKETSRKTKQQSAETANSNEVTVKSNVNPFQDPIVAAPSKLTDDEQSLLAKHESSFVLQWVGVSSRAAAEKYRESHIAQQQMSIYRRASKGKTLFIIISDSFSNRALAEFALNDYIQQGIKEKPWIKPLIQVQKEIRQFEQQVQ